MKDYDGLSAPQRAAVFAQDLAADRDLPDLALYLFNLNEVILKIAPVEQVWIIRLSAPAARAPLIFLRLLPASTRHGGSLRLPRYTRRLNFFLKLPRSRSLCPNRRHILVLHLHR